MELSLASLTCAIFAKLFSSVAKISLISIHTHNSGQSFFHQSNLLADSANFSPTKFLSFTVPQETYHIVRIWILMIWQNLCDMLNFKIVINNYLQYRQSFVPHIYVILITAVISFVGHSLKFCPPKNLNSWFCQCFLLCGV